MTQGQRGVGRERDTPGRGGQTTQSVGCEVADVLSLGRIAPRCPHLQIAGERVHRPHLPSAAEAPTANLFPRVLPFLFVPFFHLNSNAV